MSTPKRGRPRAVSEFEIVEAALRLSDATSFDALTMRALAADLEVGAMTIYNYVPNKEALAERMCDHLLQSIEAPSGSDVAWEERLFALQNQIREALDPHPRLRTTACAQARRLAHDAKAILTEAGFGPIDAQLAYGALSALTLGPIDARRKADRDQIFEFGFRAVIASLPQPTEARRARRPLLRGRSA